FNFAGHSNVSGMDVGGPHRCSFPWCSDRRGVLRLYSVESVEATLLPSVLRLLTAEMAHLETIPPSPDRWRAAWMCPQALCCAVGTCVNFTALEHLLQLCRRLYNCALEQRSPRGGEAKAVRLPRPSKRRSRWTPEPPARSMPLSTSRSCRM